MGDERAKRIAELIAPLRVEPGSTVRLPGQYDPAWKADVITKEAGADLLRTGIAMVADQARLALTSQLEEAGLRAPDQDVIVQVLGNDGGAVCEDPNDALARASLAAQLVNGAGGPGTRPVIADGRVLEGQLAIIRVYCPDELEAFQDLQDRLETAEVAG